MFEAHHWVGLPCCLPFLLLGCITSLLPYREGHGEMIYKSGGNYKGEWVNDEYEGKEYIHGLMVIGMMDIGKKIIIEKDMDFKIFLRIYYSVQL